MTAPWVAVPVRRVLSHPRLASLGLRLLAGEDGLQREVGNPRLQKPGLALAGYLPYLKPGRVQVIGASEAEFLLTLSEDLRRQRAVELIAVQPPALVVCKGLAEVAEIFAVPCREHSVPLALTDAMTSEVIDLLSATLEFLLAPREVLHGDLLDIFAIGVLLLGDSGSGKSECALELVHRGHRLVADDVVEVFRVRTNELIGQAPEEIRGLMEVRGLGLISIEQLFGVVAVRDNKPIDLVVRLVPEGHVHVDRLGLTDQSVELLGIRRPSLTVAIAPGRSLSLLIEAAARKVLLRQRGVTDAAREYLEKRDRSLETV